MQAARTWGLDLPDLRRNPQVPQFAGYGAVFARWGKSSNGSPPTRRTVLTVLEMDWAVPVLQQWVEQVRPLVSPGNLPDGAAFPRARNRPGCSLKATNIQQLDRCLTDETMPLDLRVEHSCCYSRCWSAASRS
ncbi:MAG TPA: hypothetical protein VN695_10135 [Streptosporangiaceae bacterium]|nr:hypothetical protein [Streptosporangiaceae bacterium]